MTKPAGSPTSQDTGSIHSIVMTLGTATATSAVSLYPPWYQCGLPAPVAYRSSTTRLRFRTT